jgi:hypothetical protein
VMVRRRRGSTHTPHHPMYSINLFCVRSWRLAPALHLLSTPDNSCLTLTCLNNLSITQQHGTQCLQPLQILLGTGVSTVVTKTEIMDKNSRVKGRKNASHQAGKRGGWTNNPKSQVCC